MISRQTVLIIGAGAGFDIGMCLGSTLMAEIATDVNFFYSDARLVRGNGDILAAIRQFGPQKYNELFNAGRQIASGVRTSGSIDNYIHNHRNNDAIKTVGKIAIVKTNFEV